MLRHKINRILFAMSVVALAATSALSGETVSEVAKPQVRPAGAPRLSDVSMRLFTKKKDHSELAAAKAFHITRADWSYINDPEYIQAVHDLGWTFQGSTNAVTHDPAFAQHDNSGEPVLDHFHQPGRYWADDDNEAYRQWYVNQLCKWVEAGADSIQRDEPTTCHHTPIPEAAEFHKDARARFEKKIGRHVPMSCNLAWNRSMFGGKGEPVAKLFDFGMAEMARDKVAPDFLWNASTDARQRGKALIYTSHQHFDVPMYRRAIAGCYATGMQFMVPWDQYGGVGKPRVFSRPEDLADLYGFVRAIARYLDGYEDAAAVGHRLKDSRWQDNPVLDILGNDRVSAFVRAKPGERNAPVVIHLIDWGKPRPFQLRLHPRAFFGTDEIAVSLETPTPFDAATHEKAEASKSYAPLSRSTALKTTSDQDGVVVNVPALHPWGMLIVSKQSSSK